MIPLAGQAAREIYEVRVRQTGGKATHAGGTYNQVQPGKMDEYIRIIRVSSAPAIRQLPGWKGGFWLTDADTGKRMEKGLWETEAYASGYESGGSQQAGRGNTAHLMVGPSTREVYEVSAQV